MLKDCLKYYRSYNENYLIPCNFLETVRKLILLAKERCKSDCETMPSQTYIFRRSSTKLCEAGGQGVR